MQSSEIQRNEVHGNEGSEDMGVVIQQNTMRYIHEDLRIAG